RDPNNFIKQQERDQLKKELCEENLIALRYIWYYEDPYEVIPEHLRELGNVTSSRRDKAMSQQGEYVVCGGRTKIRHMSQHIHGQGKTLLEFLALRCTNADTRSSTQQIVKKSCSVILIK
ncbi:11881_t:CDS:2, partial [Funneliformis geosporum]